MKSGINIALENHANGSPTELVTTLLENGSVVRPYFGPALIERSNLELKDREVCFEQIEQGFSTTVTISREKLECATGPGRDGSCHRVEIPDYQKPKVEAWIKTHFEPAQKPATAD